MLPSNGFQFTSANVGVLYSVEISLSLRLLLFIEFKSYDGIKQPEVGFPVRSDLPACDLPGHSTEPMSKGRSHRIEG